MRAEKNYLIKEVETHLKKSDYVILTNFSKVTVADAADLRKRLEAEARNRLAPQRAELKRVERELEVCLAERQTLEARLADPALYASADPAVRALPAAHAALLTRIHDLEERWLMLSEELGQ